MYICSVHISLFSAIYIYIYICMYVCMYVWFFFSAFFSAFVFWMGLGRIGDQLSYSNAICDSVVYNLNSF